MDKKIKSLWNEFRMKEGGTYPAKKVRNAICLYFGPSKIIEIEKSLFSDGFICASYVSPFSNSNCTFTIIKDFRQWQQKK